MIRCYNHLISKAIPNQDNLIITSTDSGVTRRLLGNCLTSINGGVDYKEGISDVKIVDFCINLVYRLSRVQKKNIDFYKERQIFGKSNINKYLSAPDGVRHYERQFLKDIGVSKNELLMLIVDRDKHPLAKYVHVRYDERTKSRALNTNYGYYLCGKSTLLWSPTSEACSKCIYVEECKVRTKNTHPEIYRLRTKK